MAVGKPPIKKEWYEILAPEEFGSTVIGETYAGPTPEAAIGRKAFVSAAAITRQAAKQGYLLIFKIYKAENKKLLSKVFEYKMLFSALKKLIKKGRSKIDLSFIVHTKDNKKIRVKPIIQTKFRTSRAIRAEIQANCIDIIKNLASKLESQKLFYNCAFGLLQKEVKGQLNKIFPIALFEFRWVKSDD